MERNRKAAESPAFRFSPRPNRAHEINWRLWDDAAFAESRKDGKPVFLTISAFWCHWCHVMDETTYSDPDVIKLLNEEYVPVRVDTDQRPDVNRRYNQGGWPSFDILAPTGEILVGGTYVVPVELKRLLTQVRSYYATHRDEVQRKIEEARIERARIEAEPPPAGTVTEQVVGSVLGLVRKAYDPTYGGFDRAPKFPQVDALDLLLQTYYRTQESSWLDMVTNTLDHMMQGGLFDKVSGGFFRYATTREWSVPHYEKMLEDNSQLITLFLKASQFGREEQYQYAARATLAYFGSTLLDPKTGCFYGSQDAEEEYYLLPKEEREKRKGPFVDPVIYADWNALASTAYITAYRILGEDGFLARALNILDFLWFNCRHETRGMFHYWDGRPHFLGLLSDQVRMAASMLEAYGATSKSVYLQRAEKLAEIIRRDYYDEVGGGFFDAAPEQVPGAVGRLKDRDKSIIDNSAAADLLLALFALTDKDAYHMLAERALKGFLDDYPQYGLSAAVYARAVDHFIHEPVKVTIVGRRNRLGTQRLFRESLRVYAPAIVVELLDPDRDKQRIQDFGYATGPMPSAYICHKKTCSAPVERAEDIVAVLDAMI